MMLDKLMPFKSQFSHPPIDLNGFRALIITTSQATLDKYDKTTGRLTPSKKKTGVYASEMTEPYYTFLDAGVEVDIASIAGGNIPVDPLSMIYPARTKEDWRFCHDPLLKEKVAQSMKIDEIDVDKYDILFIAGGWGAAYDLMQSNILANKISEAYANKKILASVCHGALGFCSANKMDGSPLVKDVKVTGVTNAQLRHLMISRTPKHPEDELKSAGADYVSKKGTITDLFSNCVVVDKTHRIISGQNQKSGVETAYKAMLLLREQQL